MPDEAPDPRRTARTTDRAQPVDPPTSWAAPVWPPAAARSPPPRRRADQPRENNAPQLSCNPPHTDAEGPRDVSCPLGRSPMVTELIQQRSHWIVSALAPIPGDRGPACEIPAQLAQGPLDAQLERRHRDFLKWKRNRPIAIVDPSPRRAPVRAQRPGFELPQQRFDVVARATGPIGPCGDHATRDHDAADFSVERLVRQPVKCLCNRDEVSRTIWEAAILCRRDAILDIRHRWRVRNLLGARVGGDHAIEVAREISRRLAASRRAVPRKMPTGYEGHDLPIERVGVARARGSISSGLL